MSIESRLEGEVVFHTGMLENPNLTRRLRASTLGPNGNSLLGEINYADLDELTGRIMVVVGPIVGRRQYDLPYTRRLYIALSSRWNITLSADCEGEPTVVPIPPHVPSLLPSFL